MSQQPEKVPNETTLEAMRDAEQGKNLTEITMPVEQWLDSIKPDKQN